MHRLKVLMFDAASGFYRMDRYKVGDFFGPVDLGIHLAYKHNSLNIGAGLLAGSVLPGSNRLIFSGISPCWHGFFISSMGGAALVFDNLGINMVSIINKASAPSLPYLNRRHGEEIEAALFPLELHDIWQEGRKGVYAVMTHALEQLGDRYETDPRVLATGPAAQHTDFGAIASCPLSKGKPSHADTWAGRGGFGTKMLMEHGIAGIIYGGTFVDDDFRDRKVADEWFEKKYNQRMAARDYEATTKYRFDPQFQTGGTFGVNFATQSGDTIAFNYRSIYWTEEERIAFHHDFIVNHYLKQFNAETIATKQQKTCGEPCAAVCKKLRGEFKKDYEPYQSLGPLCGVFDQRAAEKLNQAADSLGFDAVSAGGVAAWLMECLHERYLSPDDVGVSGLPAFEPQGFDIVEDSMHNAALGAELLHEMVRPDSRIPMQSGPRKLARRLAREKGKPIMDCFVYNAFARQGWMVPNQYWTPGVLSPMAIMGKYYMYYGKDFLPPYRLGQENAKRTLKELMLDNLGFCRFHRAWAEEIIPDIVEKLFGCKDAFLRSLSLTAGRIASRNASVFWESERNIDIVWSFMKRKRPADGGRHDDLDAWLKRFSDDKRKAALDFWYEVHKGAHEALREFPA